MNARLKTRILLIEDNVADALLLEDALSEAKGFTYELVHVSRLEEGSARLKDNLFDVVLLDLNLPDSLGIDTFTHLHQQIPELPVLVLTALNDEAVGVKAVHLGAQDYIVKGQVQPLLLARMVKYAIERQRFVTELFKSRQQLRDLAARLQDMRESERSRLAREVHDILGQLLTALKLDLRYVEKKLVAPSSPDSVAVMLEKVIEAEQLADQAVEAIQKIALELRPSVLDNLGLVEAIWSEARRFESLTGVRMKMSLSGDLPKLKPETNTAFFRIFQESLTNVARHANAQSMAISLGKYKDTLELVMQDDGAGLPAKALTQRTSLGLLGMSERALSVGGEIKFEGVSGKGTRTILKLPLSQACPRNENECSSRG